MSAHLALAFFAESVGRVAMEPVWSICGTGTNGTGMLRTLAAACNPCTPFPAKKPLFSWPTVVTGWRGEICRQITAKVRGPGLVPQPVSPVQLPLTGQAKAAYQTILQLFTSQERVSPTMKPST